MFRKNIPNIVTSGNLAFGFLAIILASEGLQHYAILSILIGMLLDTIDGRLARLLKVEGDFGKELDSLADVITFGVAPAFILYQFCLQDIPSLTAALIVTIFPICGGLRLARFNVQHAKIYHHFVGLPITAAGTILTVLSVLGTYFSTPIYIFSILILSFLMVSNIKHPNFKKIPFPKHALAVVPILSLIVFFLQKYTPIAIPILIGFALIFYTIILFIQTQYKRKKNRQDNFGHNEDL